MKIACVRYLTRRRHGWGSCVVIVIDWPALRSRLSGSLPLERFHFNHGPDRPPAYFLPGSPLQRHLYERILRVLRAGQNGAGNHQWVPSCAEALVAVQYRLAGSQRARRARRDCGARRTRRSQSQCCQGRSYEGQRQGQEASTCPNARCTRSWCMPHVLPPNLRLRTYGPVRLPDCQGAAGSHYRML